jgi:hypothetical protein
MWCCRVFGADGLELNPAAAILGGVLGGEIIKVVSVGWRGGVGVLHKCGTATCVVLVALLFMPVV